MRICLVIDDPFSSRILQEFLSDLKHEVVTVSSIRRLSGRQKEILTSVDLVLLDQAMLTSESTQLLRAMHQAYPDPLMILASDHFPFLPDAAMSLGIHRYLRKPIHLDELEFALRSLCSECARCKFLRGESEQQAQAGDVTPDFNNPIEGGGGP